MDYITKKQAIEQGLKKFFDGRPCRYGHVSEKYVKGGNCVKCVSEKAKKWQAKNPEKVREASRKWSVKNEKEYRRKRGQQYPDEQREASRRYRQRNLEKIAQYNKSYYQQNREREIQRVKARWEDDPEARNIARRDYEARKKGAEGTYGERDIEDLKKIQLNKCNMCLCELSLSGYHVDHIMPLALGGHNGLENIQLLCPTCNRIKNARHPQQTIGAFLER